jgi:hypothetical protein
LDANSLTAQCISQLAVLNAEQARFAEAEEQLTRTIQIDVKSLSVPSHG